MDCLQALLWGFSRQEYWRGSVGPPPGDLLDPGTKPRCPALQADSLLSEPPGKQTYKLKDGKKYGEKASCYYRAVNRGLIVKVMLGQRPELGEDATLVDSGETSTGLLKQHSGKGSACP